MMAVWAAVVSASLLGSLHCAGMCGPLVAFALGGRSADGWRRRALLQCGYHGARLASYAAIGAVCGLLGAAFNQGGTVIGLHRAASLLAGGMMVAVGLATLAQAWGLRLPHMALPWAARLVMLGNRLASGLQPLPRAATIGALTAFLPCGWLYAFALVAAGTGTAWEGAAVMVAFWVGTVPVLASLGFGIQTVLGAFGRRLPQVTALVIVVLGLFTLVERQSASARILESARAIPLRGDTAKNVSETTKKRPPCCEARERKS
jgi:sulfite exporter TauE/SafE